MPDDSAIIKQISHHAYQVLVNILQHHPEWLTTGYRYIPWKDIKYQSAFIAGLSKKLEGTEDKDALMSKVRDYLRLFLEHSFFESSAFDELEAAFFHILSYSEQIIKSNGFRSSNKIKLQASAQTVMSGVGSVSEAIAPQLAMPQAIAILLLDAENLVLDRATEDFLRVEVCTYPIQVKIAFANWKSRGKQDIELHERGYDLIHVPVGRDHADGKMLIVGASLREHYPTVREVLVCSSDTVMTNLCNQLQNRGLTVHHVRRQGYTITVSNCQTGETKLYTIKQQLPTPEELIKQLKGLIRAEQKIGSYHDCVKISRISQIYQEKYQLTLIQVVYHHNLGDKDEDIFINHTSDFAVYQKLGELELYVNTVEFSSNHPIESQSDLEQALATLLNKLISESQDKYIFISTLGSRFRQDYHETIRETLARVGWEGTLTQFLQRRRSFLIDRSGNQVTLAQR